MERLYPSEQRESSKAIPGGKDAGAMALARRWAQLKKGDEPVSELAFLPGLEPSLYSKNIENLVGAVSIPLGAAGPLRVNGVSASGDYPIMLATTEAALVASVHRGARLISAAGGCAAALLNEAVNRSPAFTFRSMGEAGSFAYWVLDQVDKLKALVSETSRYAVLEDVSFAGEGNHLYLNFEFTTGDAAGQNMVTIATQVCFDYLLEYCPTKPLRSYVEGNLSGDKKASAQAFITVRGKKVCAEVEVPAALVRRFLHVEPAGLEEYWKVSAIGGVLSGTIGVQGHYANTLAALFAATGQDIACVAESAVGVTRLECTEGGDLYAAVTLPNLVVGTVGGGTGLPSQSACLELMDLVGEGKAAAFAEVTAGAVLAGELSIIGALASGDFTEAHKNLAR